MDSEKSFSINNLLRYWRNTLADEDLMGLDGMSCPVRVSQEVLSSGRLDSESVKVLQKEWEEYKRQASWNQTAADLAVGSEKTIPIIILAKGYAPELEHGKSVGTRKSARAYYPLHITAALNSNGVISCTEDNDPWVGREYLRPNEEADENIPLFGDVSDYDSWIGKNPLDSTCWENLVQWCEDLWAHTGNNSSPEGFVPLDDIRIDISKSVKNAGRNLCQLYDFLQLEKQPQALLEKLCRGQSNKVEVSTNLRIRELASARGTMSTAYGLASSQADAISAFTRLKYGEILAVNGPPGTGKTTLLQSIIASEVVARAILGEEPSVIVGASTNNKAVVNINRSLNEILEENPALSSFVWASRWIPEVDTYGLYIPAGEEKANDAIKSGYAVAQRDSLTWSGFPERESCPNYLAKAESTWMECYTEVFGSMPTSIEEALERIRFDLHRICNEEQIIQEALRRHHVVTQWWQHTAGNVEPQAHLQREALSLTAAHKSAQQERIRIEIDRDRAKERQDLALSKVNEAAGEIKVINEKQKEYMRKLLGVKAHINAALVPHGLIETLVDALGIFRSIILRKQLSRLCMLASQTPLIGDLFENQISTNNPYDWSSRSDELILKSKREADHTRKIQDQKIKNLKQEAVKAKKIFNEVEGQHVAAKRKVAEAQEKKTERLHVLNDKLKELDESRLDLSRIYMELQQRAVSDFLIPEDKVATIDGVPSVKDFDMLLDITWRHMAFQKAMRYWEGRWILAAHDVQKEQVSTNNGRVAMEARFRRWCMLTPCLIITIHSLPKYFRFTPRKVDGEYISSFMLNFIDLLIIDEAGQVGPHVGAAVFSLAKRAVVVGDIYQIEPVSKVSLGTDKANSIRMGLQHLWEGEKPISPHLVSEPRDGGPQGSIMRLAQLATPVVSPGTEREPGIFLSEHRRCRKEIVQYCNDLVYKGRLQPLTQSRKDSPPLPPIAWAHVRGMSEKRGNSRMNPLESASIAGWIADNAESWCKHYQKPIEEIVAVITPFKPQSRLIQRDLNKVSHNFRNITVGTVHALQGAEKPIVVFSPTYNADTVKAMFFDRKPNMLNVAVSRAKDSFVVIGDIRLFRKKNNTPSAILGRLLLSEEANEIPGVDGNHRFTRQLIVMAQRISVLKDHRQILHAAIERADGDHSILIASPWISMKAINDDNLISLIERAVNQRGAKIWIVIDKELSTRNVKHQGNEALELLKQAGAIICPIDNMHNKTLINGRSEIIEGSFNWLSANRKTGDKFIRHEVSWKISGESATGVVSEALREFQKLGVKFRVEEYSV